MDAERFDTLSRTLAAGHSRRGLNRFLGGLALGGTLGLLGLTETAAKKRKKKKKKRKKTGSAPVPPAPPFCASQADGAPCGFCRRCQSGTCAADPAQNNAACGSDGTGRCLNGVCNPTPPCTTASCPYTEVCQEGTCINCLGQSCTANDKCCTNYCSGSVCACVFGNFGPDFGCTSHAQCCNGTCIFATGKCACDPAGSPCTESSTCCGTCSGSGVCQ